MTPSGNKSKSSFREYFILVIIILVGTPIAIWWGHKDGKQLAAQAYGDAASGAQSGAGEEVGATDEGEIPASSPEAVARGAALFQIHCIACHGTAADGKGPAAVAFTPAPRDFTDPQARWTRGREPAQIHASVGKGIEGTGMTGFAAAMSADELWDVVHYLSSLPGVKDAP
jgi:mono/diheme cytochrome c family protein